jgi:GDSL-like Lipase/Acylhydrolase family
VNLAALLPLIPAVLLLLLASAAAWTYVLLRMQKAEFWEFQICEFERADKVHPPEPGAILFTGSSSIRFWRTLERDMAPLQVLNRGFGGCHLAHVNHYIDRIVLPYFPCAIVLYAGENDLGSFGRKTPGVVLEQFKRFVATVHQKLPDTRVYFLAIKRTPWRRRRWAAMDEANRLVRDFAAGKKGVDFVDNSHADARRQGRPSTRIPAVVPLSHDEQGLPTLGSNSSAGSRSGSALACQICPD